MNGSYLSLCETRGASVGIDNMVYFVEGKARRASNREVGAAPWTSQLSKRSRLIGPGKRPRVKDRCSAWIVPQAFARRQLTPQQ